MIWTTLDTASVVFLTLVVILVFSLFVASFVPVASRSAQQGLPAIAIYVAAELAALSLALSLVSMISSYEVLPTLLALVIAALVFIPGVIAKLPIPTNWTGAAKS